MALPDEKPRFRPLFRFTDRLVAVDGLMPDGSTVPVKTKRMAFVALGNKVVLDGNAHIECEWVGGPLDGGRFAIPIFYAESREAWASITDLLEWR